MIFKVFLIKKVAIRRYCYFFFVILHQIKIKQVIIVIRV